MATDLNVVVLVVSHFASLAFSGAITYFAYRAYQRTGSVPMRSLTIGFGVISAGLLFAGGLYWFTGLDLETSVTIQSVFTMVGFAFLMYSIFVDGTSPGRRTEQ